MDTKIYIDDRVAEKWRELAMKRFGYGRGSISKAAEEAIVMWVENEEKIDAALQKLKEIAEKEKGVAALLLFGSYARKEPYHDVDIAIVAPGIANRIAMLERFERLVPEHPKFDFVIFDDMPLNMKSRMLSECKLIYARRGFDIKELAAELLQKWSDLKPMLDAPLVEK
ncbi:MAG: nucleotidyltransferase domain-containing protein [Candidatus Micrarchaeaceae archaeon]